MELIVSDNANIDETQSVLSQFSSDPRLKVIRTEELLTCTENWNKALETCSGDYMLLIGDDDCLLSGFFQKMDQVLEKFDFPECVTFNGMSYISPGAVNDNPYSYYKDPFFPYGPEFQEGLLSLEMRTSIVKDMYSFKVRIPLNIQPHLFSRRARKYIEGDLFRPPFPDHFALNALLIHTKTWAFTPEKLVVVGVSPKSYGHFVYSNKQEEGQAYCGFDSEFEGQLPGLELHNGMHKWLDLLKLNYKEKLNKFKINRSAYVRRQVFSWFHQLNAGVLKPKNLLKRFGQLSILDWVGLLLSVFDKRSWERIGSLFGSQKDHQIQITWQGATTLKEVSDIKEFADWVDDQQIH
jgi:glycosyltransferase involved in cell wall biosynthesis